jgi:hypothetical protein
MGRDCFVAQSAPRNDNANLIGICSNYREVKMSWGHLDMFNLT